MFTSILNLAGEKLSISAAGLCTGVSMILGAVVALCYYFTGKCTKQFFISLIILPALVQTVVMLVNGSLGTGMAIVGAFSLVRYRSVPGTSREICAVFFAMVIGLVTGMGYLTYAVFITLFVGAVMVILTFLPVTQREDREQSLKITMYENLDYTEVFDDVFDKYLRSCQLQSVRTVNMGSMYQIHYIIEMKDRKQEKEFLDALRCRNGNLTIICGRVKTSADQL